MRLLPYLVALCLYVVCVGGRLRHAESMTEWLIGSLRSHRRQACESEKVSLKCPQYTHIHMETTFYGRLVPSAQLCPVVPKRKGKGKKNKKNRKKGKKKEDELDDDDMDMADDRFFGDEPRLPPHWDQTYEDTSCDVTNAHTKVIEKCQERRKCRVAARPQFFGRDPCPTTSKYLHISYKCKPSQFSSEYFCEGGTMQLSCKPKRRLAIFSAIYGRTAQLEQHSHMTCKSPQQPTSDCTFDVLGRIAGLCHARQQCSLGVNDANLGNPCPAHISKYLNLIFMCVDEDVFSEEAIKGELPLPDNVDVSRGVHEADVVDESSVHQINPLMTAADDAAKRVNEKTALNNDAAYAPVLDANVRYSPEVTAPPRRGAPPTCLAPGIPNAVGFIHNCYAMWNFMKAHKEKFLLYFCLSSACGVILLLMCCIIEQCFKRLTAKDGGQRGQSDQVETYPLNANAQLFPDIRGAKCEEYGSYSPSGLDTTDSRLELPDLTRNGVSFMRFNHPTPPRQPPPMQYYS